MQAGERGWWHAEVESARHGSSYAFVLDDDPHPYPDPRSPWQPDGVHGFSRVLDHSLFPWSDEHWQPPPLADAVIYELHIGTFTPEGTFDAAASRIDYLRELGITHVELMPVATFAGRWGWGYDGTALYAPQEPYGGPDGLKRLVDACHAAGLAVLLDVVYNHFGPVGNYTGRFGPYLDRNHRTPWGDAVNLEEAGSDEVRRFFCDNAILWLRDYHFDGLRLDAVHAFVDRSAIHFLEQLSTEVDALSLQLGRPLVLIAESDLNDPRVVTPRCVRRPGHYCAVERRFSSRTLCPAYRRPATATTAISDRWRSWPRRSPAPMSTTASTRAGGEGYMAGRRSISRHTVLSAVFKITIRSAIAHWGNACTRSPAPERRGWPRPSC